MSFEERVRFSQENNLLYSQFEILRARINEIDNNRYEYEWLLDEVKRLRGKKSIACEFGLIGRLIVIPIINYKIRKAEERLDELKDKGAYFERDLFQTKSEEKQ